MAEEITIPVIGGYLIYLIFIVLGLAIIEKIKHVKGESGAKEKVSGGFFDVIGFMVLIVFLIQYYQFYEFGIANDAILFIATCCFLMTGLPSLFSKS